MKLAVEHMPASPPARRHRCEICHNVFECHVCTIPRDHPMHGGRRIEHLQDPTIAIFVCEDCAVADNSIYVRDGDAERKQGSSHNALFWNYLTGEQVKAKSIGRGLNPQERKAKQRRNFIRMSSY